MVGPGRDVFDLRYRSLFERIVANVLGNAAKYAPDAPTGGSPDGS